MPYYKGNILDVTEIESKDKGTPGLQFELELTYKAHEGEYMPIPEPLKRSVWLYFPRHSEQGLEITYKKLAAIGWKGGATHRELIGNEVEVISSKEEFKGELKERFDFPLPAYKPVRSENAAMVIDQLLASAPVPDLTQEPEADINEPTAPIRDEAPDDEVPF